MNNKTTLNLVPSMVSMLAFARWTLASTLIVLVAACGGRETPVRDGPQAVHPSTSALAKSPARTPPAPYIPTPNDGSQPIID